MTEHLESTTSALSALLLSQSGLKADFRSFMRSQNGCQMLMMLRAVGFCSCLGFEFDVEIRVVRVGLSTPRTSNVL